MITEVPGYYIDTACLSFGKGGEESPEVMWNYQKFIKFHVITV